MKLIIIISFMVLVFSISLLIILSSGNRRALEAQTTIKLKELELERLRLLNGPPEENSRDHELLEALDELDEEFGETTEARVSTG